MFRKFVFIILSVFCFSFTCFAQENIDLNKLVIKNPNIEEKLPLCGNEEKGDACILYIMNESRWERMAEDFFYNAERLTERPFIKENNQAYRRVVIPKGHFAEIKIPSNIIRTGNNIKNQKKFLPRSE